MRVGVNAAKKRNETLVSVAHVLSVLRDVLGRRHEVVPFPEDYFNVAPAQKRRMAEEILQSCDVVISPLDLTLPTVRTWTNSPVPLCMLMLGILPRGGIGLESTVNVMRGSDILVVNSRADVAIARTMFQNATVRLLPFAYGEDTFYPPSPEEATAMRVRLGIPSRAPLVLYAGRCTVEKSVHTVVKVFNLVREAVPDAHLALAGAMEEVAFREFGVYPLHIAGMLERMSRKLNIMDRVHYAGVLGADDLRAMYGAADVALNMSLHHDENFGLGQVEAMACGTPVVGTRWGGLQDTILHGETGYHVSTVVTGSGVKSSWWEAANRVVQLLGDPERRQALGRRGVEVARQRFSVARHAELLESILEDAVYGTRRVREVLRVSPFAQELWTTYRPAVDQVPPVRQAPEVYALYRKLITPYAGLAEGGVPTDQPLSAAQVVFLANPVAWNEDGTLAVHDAQFPMDVQVPEEVAPAVRALLDALAEAPVTTAGALMEGVDGAGPALAWMLEEGLVLRASPALDAVDPALARATATTAMVSIQRVEHPVDVVYVA